MTSINLSQRGMAILEELESCSLKPYLDAHAPPIPTQGFGATRGLDGTRVKLTDQPWTPEQAKMVLVRDVLRTTKPAEPMITPSLSQNRQDAVGLLIFNIGPGNFGPSTLRKRINAGEEEQVETEWLRWDRAGKKQLRGLQKRRKRELDLWLS